MKICSKCQKEKPDSEFYKNKKNKDGLHYMCKQCHNEYMKKYQKKFRAIPKNYQKKEYLQKQANLGKTIIEVAQINNCTDNTVSRYARIYGIKFKHGNLKNPEDCHPDYDRKLYHKNGRKRNKKSQDASNLLYRAVNHNHLTKPDKCEICGKTNCKISGHHPNYKEPLRVIWVCPKCHKKLHNNKNNINEY